MSIDYRGVGDRRTVPKAWLTSGVCKGTTELSLYHRGTKAWKGSDSSRMQTPCGSQDWAQGGLAKASALMDHAGTGAPFLPQATNLKRIFKNCRLLSRI